MSRFTSVAVATAVACNHAGGAGSASSSASMSVSTLGEHYCFHASTGFAPSVNEGQKRGLIKTLWQQQSAEELFQYS